MAEGEIQLPPNSTGSLIRTQEGDGTIEIPSGEMQEVVTLADAVGFLPGDRRQFPTAVFDAHVIELLEDIVAEVRAMHLVLADGFDNSTADSLGDD